LLKTLTPPVTARGEDFEFSLLVKSKGKEARARKIPPSGCEILEAVTSFSKGVTYA
jgi:hypothetical protein